MEILGFTITPMGAFILLVIGLIIFALLIGFGKIKGLSWGNFKFEGNVNVPSKDYPSLRALLFSWVQQAIKDNHFIDKAEGDFDEYIKYRFMDLRGILINNKLTHEEADYIISEITKLFGQIRDYSEYYIKYNDVNERVAIINLYEKHLSMTNGALTEVIVGIRNQNGD